MTSTLSGKVQVSTPGAPAIRVEVAHSGTVAVSPGMVGPQGGGVRLDGAVPSYADLPTDLGVEDAGASWVTQDDGLLYVWSGTAWPPAGAGSQFRGDKGDRGTGVESVSVAGSDLSFGLSDGTSERVTVPALVNAASAAADAAGAADRAVSARAGAESARDGAVDAASRAEGAADGVAADAAAAVDAVGRAEVAADAADASAAAAGVSAGDAAASATSAGASATAAAGDAATASGARDSAVSAADSAQGSATAAAVDAGRAVAAADGVDQAVSDAADVLDQANVFAQDKVPPYLQQSVLNDTYADKHRDIRPSLFTYESKMELFRTVEFQDATGAYAVQQISGTGLPMLDHSADWGKTWTTLGQLPCIPSSVVRLTSGTFLVFEATSPSQPDQNPRVFRSADNGSTWTHVHTLQFPPFVHGAGVCEGTDGSVIVTEYGNVNNKNYRAYRSTDDGLTYTVTLESPLVASGGDVGHIHSVVFDPYEQCHVLFMDLANTASAGPRIYRSDDNGATWELIGEATGADTPNYVMPMFFPDYIAWGTDNERNGLIGRISRADFYAGNLTATEDVAIINLKSIYYSFPIREGVWIITVASETIMPQWAPGSPGNWGHEVYVVSNNGGTVTAGFSHLPPNTDLGVLSNQKPFTPGYRFDALDHDGMTYVNLHTNRPRATGALPVSQDWQGPNMHPVDGWGTTQPIIANRAHLGFRTTTGEVANALSVNQVDELVFTREDVALASRPEIIMKPSTGLIQFRQGGTNAAYIDKKKFILFNTLWLTPNGLSVTAGSGSPEGVVTAPPGSLFVNWSAQRGTGLWVKGGGAGNVGWEPAGAPSGSTPTRPTSPVVGIHYFDTTLGKPIWWNGTAWVDATGTAV